MPILPPIVGVRPNVDPIEEIIEYVMKTPENINANILREKLTKLVDDGNTVAIK